MKPQQVPARIREGWATDKELADFFSVHRATIWRWAKNGTISQPTKIGGAQRWKWNEVES